MPRLEKKKTMPHFASASDVERRLKPEQRRRTDVDREMQELWFRLSRHDWRSVVLVPAGRGSSTAVLASLLGDVAQAIRSGPVTVFTMADPTDYEPAVTIVVSARASTAIQRQAAPVDYVGATQIVASAAASASADRDGANHVGKVIVSVQPVVTEPLGLAVAQAADAVVLCIEEGRTRISDALKTIDLIGRDRILGSLLIRH